MIEILKRYRRTIIILGFLLFAVTGLSTDWNPLDQLYCMGMLALGLACIGLLADKP